MSPPASVDPSPLSLAAGSIRAPVPLPGCLSLVPVCPVCSEQTCAKHQPAGERLGSEKGQCKPWLTHWKSLTLASRKAIYFQSPLMSSVLIGILKQSLFIFPITYMFLWATVATMDLLSILHLMIYLLPPFSRAPKKLCEEHRWPWMLAGPLKRQWVQCWKILLAKSSILKLPCKPTHTNCSQQLCGSQQH